MITATTMNQPGHHLPGEVAHAQQGGQARLLRTPHDRGPRASVPIIEHLPAAHAGGRRRTTAAGMAFELEADAEDGARDWLSRIM